MIGKGLFEEDIDGEKVGFEFCMLSSAYTEEVSGMAILEAFKLIAESRELPLIHYFYGAARAYNELRNIDAKVTPAMVSVWLEKMGPDKWSRIYLKSIESHLPKNGQAPKIQGPELEAV